MWSRRSGRAGRRSCPRRFVASACGQKHARDRARLGGRLKHRPAELSGGEQQRVTVARGLAGSPRVVWADEPTGALDSEAAENVLELLRELRADGHTLIVVTHDEMASGTARTA